MTTNIHELERLLDQCETKRVATLDNRILSVLPAPFELPIVATMIGDGHMVELRTVDLLEMRPLRRPAACRVAATMNHRYKLAKIAVDASDGEVVVMIDLLVADESLTQRQLTRCLKILGPLAIGGRNRFDALDRTGSDPGPEVTDSYLMMAALHGMARAEHQAKVKPLTLPPRRPEPVVLDRTRAQGRARTPSMRARDQPRDVEAMLREVLDAHKDRDKA